MEDHEVYRVTQQRADQRRQWLQERNTGIGGSDAAVVLGISPWKSRYELWAEKSGSLPADESESSPHLNLGNNLEAVVLRLLAMRTGRTVEAAEPFKLVRHPERNWLFCTPDGWECGGDHGYESGGQQGWIEHRGIVQAKTAFSMNRHDWEPEPPDYYRVQLQHEMLASGCIWGTLAVLFIDQGVLTRLLNAAMTFQVGQGELVEAINDHCDFRFFDYEADAEFQAALIEAEQAFIDLIDTGTPPSTNGSESCRRAIQRLHPNDNGTEIVLPDEWAQKAFELQTAKNQIKCYETLVSQLENELKALIGDATYARLPDGSRYSWKTQTKKEYVVKASTTRVLRKEKSK